MLKYTVYIYTDMDIYDMHMCVLTLGECPSLMMNGNTCQLDTGIVLTAMLDLQHPEYSKLSRSLA